MGTQSKRLAVAHFCAGPRAAAGRRQGPPHAWGGGGGTWALKPHQSAALSIRRTLSVVDLSMTEQQQKQLCLPKWSGGKSMKKGHHFRVARSRCPLPSDPSPSRDSAGRAAMVRALRAPGAGGAGGAARSRRRRAEAGRIC